ncbi:cytochrome P450 [Lasiosphaeris hirsuta]|uniref:Cytochrome P450 n=1 Tax=Lasiosphaeris hirsuta TaxID=260670 RepID=A0AA40E588_9PEZI|nr:cytochrome P450 [Lasiosphaeris hirsuta]
MDSNFTLPRVTLIALLEIMLLKEYPEARPSQMSLPALAAAILAIHYISLLIWLMFIYPFYFHPLRNFPAPKYTLISRTWRRIRTKTPPGQLLLEVAESTPNDGIIVVQGHSTHLVITKPGPLADILVHRPYDFAKLDSVREFLQQSLGDGLIAVEGDRHKFMRKNTQPAFKFSQIKELYPMMWKIAVTFTEILKGELQGAEGGLVEMSRWSGKATLDIIGLAAFGRNFRSIENPDDALVRNYEEIFRPKKSKFAYFILMRTFPRRLVNMLPWDVARMFKETMANIRAICAQMVKEKREAIAKKEENHVDILSLLIKSDNFSETELIDQMLTFMAAGHETTASVLTWTTYLLALHPSWQSDLRSELRRALPDFPWLPAGTDLASVLEHLPHLNGILNESLRLYPTVPVTLRGAVRDTTISGHAVPKGTEIIMSPWVVNRYTALWGPDATEFRPGRWITTVNGEKKANNTGGAASNYAQLTFLHGPRGCIGQGFARAELRCLIAAFVMQFGWELGMDPREVVPGGVITNKPVNGLRLKLKTV